MCVIPWCNKKNSYNLNGKESDLCIVHNSICQGTLRTSIHNGEFHKLYKWEKFFNGELLICEKCGRDPKNEYPELPGSRFMMLLDTDHIIPKKNFNIEDIHLYEHPSNYQLLCKSCHGAKSILNKDYLPKKYDHLKSVPSNSLLDKPPSQLFEGYNIRRKKLGKFNRTK
jgi:5-methylcytosine-specific restriction endonuclease McrA